MGALAFGVGSSELVHALATQTMVQRKPKRFRASFEGKLQPGVTPKDMILHLIGEVGTAAGTGHAVEYAGSAIRSLSVEGRLTLCNLSIEMGARTGMVAPDDTTYEYLADGRYAPKGATWDRAVAHWRTLPSDPDAEFDREHTIDMSKVAPQITWGTSPEHVIAVDRAIPDPAQAGEDLERGLGGRARIQGPGPGQADRGHQGRLGVHRLLHQQPHLGPARGRRDRQGPAQGRPRHGLDRAGLGTVKREAEAEGLDRVFRDAGFEWREPGCSMCIASNGERCRRASAACRPPTATSSAARGPARAPISPARRWPPPRRSRAPSPTCASSRRWTVEKIHQGDRRGRPADAPERRHRPDHPHRAPGQQHRPQGARALLLRADPLQAGRQRKSRLRVQPGALSRAPIILGRENFGCGSSREGAVWALKGMGIKAVIAPYFGDIFYNNCFQNGLLPVALPIEDVEQLADEMQASPGNARITVDLENCTVVSPTGRVIPFKVDARRQHAMLNGLDDIAQTMTHKDEIAAWQSADKTQRPWIWL